MSEVTAFPIDDAQAHSQSESRITARDYAACSGAPYVARLVNYANASSKAGYAFAMSPARC